MSCPLSAIIRTTSKLQNYFPERTTMCICNNYIVYREESKKKFMVKYSLFHLYIFEIFDKF